MACRRSRRSVLARVVGVFLLIGLSSAAFAGHADPGPKANPDAPLWRMPWTRLSGTGVGLGYANGAWGGVWAQSIRATLPLVKMAAGSGFALTATGVVLQNTGPGPTRVDVGGRLGFIGRSPVFLNLLRLYGGGGVQLFKPVREAADKTLAVGGGGFLGMEAFLRRWMSFSFEVGGSSGSKDAFGAGATIMASVTFYPF